MGSPELISDPAGLEICPLGLVDLVGAWFANRSEVEDLEARSFLSLRLSVPAFWRKRRRYIEKRWPNKKLSFGEASLYRFLRPYQQFSRGGGDTTKTRFMAIANVETTASVCSIENTRRLRYTPLGSTLELSRQAPTASRRRERATSSS